MLILASASPRRKRLLEFAGVDFIVKPVDIDETPKADETPENLVYRLSESKAMAAYDRGYTKENGYKILGSDTIVVLGDKILGKPKDRNDAKNMLSMLSGNTHTVMTGVCVVDKDGNTNTKIIKSDVTFRPLYPAEIENYIDSKEPYDKAGAYAIQGTGGAMVDSVDGSYTNVIGLPLKVSLEMIGYKGQ